MRVLRLAVALCALFVATDAAKEKVVVLESNHSTRVDVSSLQCDRCRLKVEEFCQDMYSVAIDPDIILFTSTEIFDLMKTFQKSLLCDNDPKPNRGKETPSPFMT